MPKLIPVVGGDIVTRKLLRDALLAFGYNVIEAGDGKTAVASAMQFLPKLIIMDIKLPVMSGDIASMIT